MNNLFTTGTSQAKGSVLKQLTNLALLLMLSAGWHTTLQAQFFSGGQTINEGKLKNRSWHISNVLNDRFLAGNNAGDAPIVTIDDTRYANSTWVIVDGGRDENWYTSDGHYFAIQHAATGKYLTAASDQEGSATYLDTLLLSVSPAQKFRQQFEVVPAISANEYLIRNRNGALYLKVNTGGILTLEGPAGGTQPLNRLFYFNLAFPTDSTANYTFIIENSKKYVTDAGFTDNNRQVIQSDEHNLACLWNFIKQPDGYYYIRNRLTGNYLSNNGIDDTGTSAPIYTNTAPSENTKWELVRDGIFFNVRHKITGHSLGNFGLPYNNAPIQQAVNNALGTRWTLVESPEISTEVKPGNFGTLNTTSSPFCDVLFGPQFKRAVAERVGLPAEESYFPFIESALTYQLGSSGATYTALKNFNLDSVGHRVFVAFAVRQYIFKDVINRPPSTWSSIEQSVLGHYQSKIQALRQAYAQNVQSTWVTFNSSYLNQNYSDFNNLLANLDADNFRWPADYAPTPAQVEQMFDYAAVNRQLNNTNTEIGLKASTAATLLTGPGTGTLISFIVLRLSQASIQASVIAGKLSQGAVKLIVRTSAIVSQAVTGSTSSVGSLAISALSSLGAVVNVVSVAAQILAAEIMDAMDVESLGYKVQNKIAWANAPVDIAAVMAATNELDKIRIVTDLEFLLGAPAPDGFQKNYNDNVVVNSSAFDLYCHPVEVALDQTGHAEVQPTEVSGGLILANCGGQVMLSLSQTTFDGSDIGYAPVTLTASNDVQTLSCNTVIHVIDNTPPTAKCKNATLNLTPFGNATLPVSAINDGSADNAGIASLTLNQVGYNCSFLGLRPVTLTVKDLANNTSTCTATVNVQDVTPPIAWCENKTIALNSAGQATLTMATLDPNNFTGDNCSVSNVTISKTAFDCTDVGPNSVTVQAVDGSGNTNQCTATVTVQDNMPPTALCKPATVYLDANGHGALALADFNNGSSDACGIQSLVLSDTDFDCSKVGPNLVTLTVTDNHGQQAQCYANVMVLDNLPPVAQCKPATLQLAGGGVVALNIADVNNGSSDNCGIQSLTVSPTGFNCGNTGTNTVTLTVKDIHNNTSTCTATVTVQDVTPPDALCHSRNVQLNAAGVGSVTALEVDAGSNDACGIQSMTLNQHNFTCANLGINTVTLTVKDFSNNTGTCSATVTVQDNIPPTITCPGNIVKSNDPGECSAVVNYAVTPSDNCSFSLDKLSGYNSGQPFPVGVTSTAFRVTDAAGHQANCSFTVTVSKFGDPDLLYAYTIIGLDDVKLKGNTVAAGGVGVQKAGKKVKLEGNTIVTAVNTFVKSPQLDFSGSPEPVYYQGQFDENLLPAFLPNTNPANNNLNVPDNSAPVTLNLGSYGKIEIGKNVTATFSGNATVLVKELTLKEGATLLFAQNTQVLIDKQLDLKKNSTLDKGTHTVWMFVEDQVSIDEGSDVAANIYSQKSLKIEKAAVNNPTTMTGLFIADKVDAKEYVNWNWDAGQCPFAPPSVPLIGLPDFNAIAQVEQGTPQVDFWWISDQDFRNDYFLVERTRDGENFEPVVEKSSRYADAEPHLYRSSDPVPLEGVWLYRLKVTRRDGTVDYSELKRVIIELPNGYTLFPNPAGNQVNLSLKGHEGKAALLQIINSQGLVVGQREVESLPAEPLSFDLHNYRDGMYYLNVRVEGKRSRAMRFVVVKN